jgi:hypothetical protein
MPFQDNFIVLIEYRMVDPVLKVAVQRTRFNMTRCDQPALTPRGYSP